MIGPAPQRILILAPHADDAELGCGGSIARWVEEERAVHVFAFSRAHEEGLCREFLDACDVLGVQAGRRSIGHFEVRCFPDNRQAVLDRMIAMGEETRPDLVLVPSPDDIHQDHQVVAAEGLRAFKRCSVLGYELPWNNPTFSTRCFVTLEERHVEAKVRALACYRSQAHRSYLDEEFIRSLARTRGTQLERRYAEAFEVLRWVIS